METESSTGSPEISVEQKKPEDIKETIIASIKDKTDKEGAMLFEAYKESVNDSERSPVITETYENAKYSFDNLDNEGEVNKLVASLDALYKQAGVSEGYKPEIKYESDEEKQKLLKEAITSDFNNYPELYAESKIESYVDARVRITTAEDKAAGIVEEDLFTRASFRRAVYGVQQARTGLLNVVEEEGRKLKEEAVVERIKKGIEEGWVYKEEQLEKDFGDLEKDEQSKLVEESVEYYQARDSSLVDERHRETVGNLTDDEKSNIFGKTAGIDRKIKLNKDNLNEAIRNSPDQVVKLASEIRSLQVEKEVELAHASISIAEKRTKSVRESWSESKDELLRKLQKGGPGYVKEGTWGKFKGSLKEWADSKTDELDRKAGSRVTELIAQVDEGVDKVGDKFRGVLNKVDEVVFSRAKDVAEKFRKYQEKLRDSKARDEADTARRKMLRLKTYYQARHSTENWFREVRAAFFVRSREIKWEAWSSLGYLGGEEVKKETRERMERISKVSEKDFDRRVKRISESTNPHMEGFQKDLDKRVKFVKIVTESEIPAAPAKADGEERKRITSSEVGVERRIESEEISVEEQLLKNVDRVSDKAIQIREKVKKREASQGDLSDEVERWTKQIEDYNGYMDAIIKDRGLDSEENDDYRKFEEAGKEIGELYRRIKEEKDLEKKFRLVGRYHDLVVNEDNSRWSAFNKLRPKEFK